MHGNPDISVILVSFNTASTTRECLRALRAAEGWPTREILVVDNASIDDSATMIRQEFPEVTLIINSENVGFARANNQALASARGRFLLLLNTDAFIEPDALKRTVEYMEQNPACGILGARLIGRDGRLQPSARYFPTPWNLFLARTGLESVFPGSRLVDDMEWDHSSVRSCDWVPGCFYLVRRAVVDEVGLFDPRYFLYYEEVDHCYAAKQAGWQVIFFPGVSVVHLGGESADSIGDLTPAGRQIEALQMESELLYFRKNHGLSGTIANVFLETLGDAINAGKRLVRFRRPLGFLLFLRHSALVWQLFFRTRFGTVSIH